MLANELVKALESGRYDSVLENIYQESERAKKRYIEAVNEFIRLYGDLEVGIYSAPGRSEIGGNHTDHQHGKVLAAAIDLDMICVVSFQEDGIVQLSSKGYEIKPVDINDLNVHPEQFGTSESLIRGIAKRFSELGKNISGFKGYMISDVLGGSGLSSSAAFESLIGAIFSFGLNEGSVDAVEIAKIGQYAENVYFNKPCGLMDQTACAVGGFVSIDFAGEPVVKQVDFDMNTTGYSLCIVDTKGSHADLTDEYAAMPIEMKMVARYFGKEYLNDIDPKEFFANIRALRTLGNDRCIMRAYHFVKENARVDRMAESLSKKDFSAFLDLVKQSGNSSYKYLQNVYAASEPTKQEIAIALAVAEEVLGEHGVARVHGGGISGTIQAYVRNEDISMFKEAMEAVFGESCVYVLHVRQTGCTCVIR